MSAVLGHHDPHAHDHDHDHEHHDHSHVAMQSAVVRWSGALDRSRLEAALESQIRDQTLLRLKGRAWLPGNLPELVRAVAAAAPESWIRLHYCYPNDFSDQLIAAITEADSDENEEDEENNQ